MSKTKPEERKNHESICTKGKSILQLMESAVELSAGSKLSAEFFEKAAPALDFIGGQMSLSREQALLLSVMVNYSDDRNIRVRDVANHFDCKNITILQYMKDFDELERRHFIRCSRSRDSQSYRVPMEVLNALKNGEAYKEASHAGIDCDALFAVIDDLFGQRQENELTTRGLYTELRELLDENPKLEFCRKVRAVELDEDDFILLLFFCNAFVNNDDDNIQFYELDDLFDSKLAFRRIKSSLCKRENDLFGLKLIENTGADGIGDRESFKLTDSAKEDLLSELGLNLKSNMRKQEKRLLKHEDLPFKKMFYNPSEGRQVERLTSLLKQENFVKIQARLKDSGMRHGFACIFYGSPGTGKTETVYQIAKATGRDIMQVNVSEIKSMWVGESEKNIQALFDRYRVMAESSDGKAPILFFNEADAIFGKRQEGAERAVDKMENSIQNIILQEMEKLSGILIATTNLTQNLDKAFERRFLYKIRFEKPSAEARKAIWTSMMDDISDEEAEMLSGRYDFSGGQIENISRKHTVDKILYGDEGGSIDRILEMCDSENISEGQDGKRRIGF